MNNLYDTLYVLYQNNYFVEIYIYIIYILSENILYVLNINNNKYNINFSKQETFYLKRYILHFYFINNC